MQEQNDLKLMLESKVPILVIETYEEPRAVDILSRLAIQMMKPAFAWSVTEGFRRIDFSTDTTQKLTSDPESALGHIKSVDESGIYILCDFHPYLQENPKAVRLLKEIAMAHQSNRHSVVLLSHSIEIPPEVKRYTARFELALPTDEQILSIVREEAMKWSKNNKGRRVKTDNRTLKQLVKNLRGLTFADVKRLTRGAIIDDGAISDEDLPEISKAKFELMDMEGVLSFEYDTASFAAVGGLKNLKAWLQQRRHVVHALDLNEKKQDLDDAGSAVEIEFPKGIMLLGIQGGGKSLAAKAVAGTWGMPLLRLDFGALYNKFIGETEKNLKESLKLADLMSPCVLWLDEIEKGISGDANDNGVSKRVLGTLLTWMAERKSKVFVVATSNDISQLPPELVRKGRLDEIFFVDLPDEEIRKEIFTIHLEGRNVETDQINVALLAESSHDFSGAEIEQAVVSALYSSSARNETITTSHVLEAIQSTNPLAVVMAEKIAALRHWSQDRTVSAN